jgi:hypothetical protein
MNTIITSPSIAQQQRLKLAYQILLDAGAHTPSEKLRHLILDIDLIAASFGVGLNNRESIDCADSELAAELVVSAAPLVRIPADLHDVLCTEIQDALARHATKCCALYIVETRLWEFDKTAWARLISLLLTKIENPEACLDVTAVIFERSVETEDSQRENQV